jgi:hypothetical protein
LNVNLRVKNLYLTRNFLKEKGVTAKTISFKEMSERHGELAEASLCEEIHNRRALVLKHQGGKF